MKQSNIKPLKLNRNITMRVVKQTPVRIDKDAVGFRDLLRQKRGCEVVGEVSRTVFKGEPFVRSAKVSVSTYTS
jgi:hypothetical protein